jgi:predicted polyphosphate/ATP-dependent NAD kinase
VAAIPEAAKLGKRKRGSGQNAVKKKAIGLVINPIAGIGGAVGLKGSDGLAVQKLALERGAVKKAEGRAMLALSAILDLREDLTVYAAAGEMGENLAKKMGFKTLTVMPPTKASPARTETAADTGSEATGAGTSAQRDRAGESLWSEAASVGTTGADTRTAVERIASLADVLLFAGGDGTARDVCAAAPEGLLTIGVPAGVKIHSAVYAVNPEAAGKALRASLTTAVPTQRAEVMDIDEAMYRSGTLQARLYGYLTTPVLRGLMQHPKAASFHRKNDIVGICEEIKDYIRKGDPGDCYLFGAGSTVLEVEKALGVQGTLLGVDVFQDGKLIAKDAAEKALDVLTRQHRCHMIITVIGGQGHIFGRGNQQFSPAVIRQIGIENILVVAAAFKIYGLPEQSLYVDTGDEDLDEMLRGHRSVIVGWQESLVCRVQ